MWLSRRCYRSLSAAGSDTAQQSCRNTDFDWLIMIIYLSIIISISIDISISIILVLWLSILVFWQHNLKLCDYLCHQQGLTQHSRVVETQLTKHPSYHLHPIHDHILYHNILQSIALSRAWHSTAGLSKHIGISTAQSAQQNTAQQGLTQRSRVVETHRNLFNLLIGVGYPRPTQQIADQLSGQC